MALNKQSLNINFAQGLDTKTDPWQVHPGNFLSLQNTIFDKGGLLQKRNGYLALTSLPDTSYTFVSTFNDDLLAVGENLSSYSAGSKMWFNKGSLQPIEVDTLSLIKSGSNQSQVDAAVSLNNLVCTVYTNNSPSKTYNYVVADVVTGQNIVEPTLISTPSEAPRVFLLGNYFMIIFSESANLNYIAIPINNPSNPSAVTTIVTNYSAGMSQLAFDGAVLNNSLYLAYNATDGGGAIRATYINSFLARQTTNTGVVIAAGKAADMMSVSSDLTIGNSYIWVTWYKTSGTTAYTMALDPSLIVLQIPLLLINSGTILNVTSSAINGNLIVFLEYSNNYSYGATLPTHYIQQIQVTTFSTTIGPIPYLRSAGLASKSFIVDGGIYVLVAYQSSYQSSYFLTQAPVPRQLSPDGSLGNIISKLAYSNGAGYLVDGLPNASINGEIAQVPYLYADQLIAANKAQGAATTNPVYAQFGINLASFDFDSSFINSSEIGSNLFISGGILWAYDGYQITEQGFNVWPDNVVATWSTSGGSIHAQPDGATNTNAYYYQVIYQFTDNQGNNIQSAPSIAIPVTTTGSGTSGSITLDIPTLRLTYKTNTPVKIIIYRWSVAQQIYYQVTSITSPTFNDPTIDSIAYVDILADSSIIGNSIIYTTGGVIEDIGAPPTFASTLFKSRMFVADAEDRNLIWYSKQVIEGTTVEFSDLFTLYIAPTIGAQGNTGPMTALSAMDDKLIIFKKDSIYYLTGNGPDNTGANNDFSDPIFITSTVGCISQRSIVFMPQGLMFQSDKGIWLLGRDLSTTYIGAPVQDLTLNAMVQSAVSIPGTNQVRFTLDSGITLMYDYYYAQWGSFIGVPAISSTLFNSLHTFIDQYGRVFQESPGTYLDGSNPVVMSFVTGWFNLAGLQGYERIYDLYLLGQYYSPHKLAVSIAYDYNSGYTQQSIISPNNYNAPWGGDPDWGFSSPYGGNPRLENWRIHTQRQTCMAFQISLQEIFDSSYGIPASVGLTLSNMNLRLGVKKSVRPIPAKTAVG